MKSGSHLSANGLIGRADLLRLLATAPRQKLWLDDDGVHQFGYLQRDTPTEHDQTDGTFFDTAPQKPAVQTGNFKLPLQMPFVHVIAERKARELPTQPENADQTTRVYEPISEDDAQPPEQHRLTSYQDLVPKARLLPALKRYLTSNRTAGLDVGLLVKQIAGQQLPRHLPRRQIKSWHPQWVVVLDFAKRLWPYRQDMHQLAEHLLHACGQSGVSIRIINHGPLLQWTDWVAEQQNNGALPAKNAWRMPPAETPILLVSDLGLLEGPDSDGHQAWQGFIRQLTKAQTKPLALLPLATEQLDAGLPNNLTVLRWSPDAHIHPERALGRGQIVPDGMEELLAMAAVTRRIDPPLLRAMRRLNPKAPLNAGLEGAFWCHADVEAGAAANIRPEMLVKHLAYFSDYLEKVHLDLEDLRYQHHAHLRAVLNHEESLLWAAHASVSNQDSEQRLQKAQAFILKLAATLKQPNARLEGGVWWQVAQDIVQRADQRMGEVYQQLLTPLVARIADMVGDLTHAPNWLDPASLALERRGEAAPCWLVRDALNGCVLLQRIPENSPHQSRMGESIIVDGGGVRIDRDGRSAWLPLPSFYSLISSFAEETAVTLTTSYETLKLVIVSRPRGANAWSTGENGLTVTAPAFCGKHWQWQENQLRPVPLKNQTGKYILIEKQFRKSLPPHTKDQGKIFLDGKYGSGVTFYLDEYGVLAELLVITPHGTAAQSLRWIEPGSFLMGSPDEELERSDDEGPQHAVTISRGFWLADTACTQALWLAVMGGDNPSHFQDDLNQPVERVSWHQVQTFLQRLQTLLPGCQMDLPSEAEWEYACRAGTQTPFSFGGNINPQQVNYDGDSPYPGAEKGEFRHKTLPVKSLPANPWGLYEMHSNVFEWCKDGQRSYDQQAQIDPLGPMAGDHLARVFRGGSWSGRAGRARSAYRHADHPDLAGVYLGFRFCLRSIESSQEQVGTVGPPDWASGASPSAVKESAKSSESGLLGKLGSFFKPGPKSKGRS